jgi:hypothetical protein
VAGGLFGQLGEGGADASELGGGQLGPFVVGVAGQVRVERARDRPGEPAEDLPNCRLSYSIQSAGSSENMQPSLRVHVMGVRFSAATTSRTCRMPRPTWERVRRVAAMSW